MVLLKHIKYTIRFSKLKYFKEHFLEQSILKTNINFQKPDWLIQLEHKVEQDFQRWQNEVGNMRNVVGVRNVFELIQFERRVRTEAELMKERIDTNVDRHRKLTKESMKYESDGRNNLEELQQLTGNCLLKQEVADDIESQQLLRQSNKKICDDLQSLVRVLLQHVLAVQDQIVELMNNLRPPVQQQGLTAARIQRFHHFPADESVAGDLCSICLDDDIEIGRSMMRLDCNGQHVFCQGCVEDWFAAHNTCPYCNHVFI